MAPAAKASAGRKGKRGRPPLPPGEGKRASFNTRLRMALKKRLEEEAVQNGRSLSEQIEFRLERALHDEDAFYRQFGGKLRYRQMQLVAILIDAVEEKMGASWQSDHDTAVQVRHAVDTFLKMLAPQSATDKSPGHASLDKIRFGPEIGEIAANALHQSILDLINASIQTKKGG